MKKLLVLETSVRVLFPSILVLSIYFLFSGHNQPGGGFVGGLAAGTGISLRYVAGGLDRVRSTLPWPPWYVLGTGLLVATTTALVPLLLGHSVLEHATWEVHVPLLGTVKATSALPFDIGVYLIVVGLVLMVFEAFGEDVGHEVDRISGPVPASTDVADEYRPFRGRPS